MRMAKRLLVTGGAGFIGSCFVRHVLNERAVETLVNLDLLTYASNLESLRTIENDPRYHFVRGDILNSALVEELCRSHGIDAIVHFAAESHVDRSIEDPRLFVRTNVEGTLSLLDVVRRFPHIHFHHVSTDEVYGSIDEGEFNEESPYNPSSPYAASKAASDHLVRAYAHTYGISTTISHSSNNYGPYQHEEKFIPRMIAAILRSDRLPVYGTGVNVRDWLYVEDHVEAIWEIIQRGRPGETYNIASGQERRNLDLLDEIFEILSLANGRELITFVKDRPGHDMRYAISGEKIWRELGWKPRYTLKEGLKLLCTEAKKSPALFPHV